MILILKYTAIAVVAYLLGAIPFGLIISKKMARVDISKVGSGNIGATNVFRVLGLKLGLFTALFDAGKAVASVLLGMAIVSGESLIVGGWDIHTQVAQVIASLMVMVGHNWSVYIGFKGGKGVAAFIGGLLVINWLVALIGLVIGVIVVLITKYVSLGSIMGAIGILFTFVIMTLAGFMEPVYLIYALLAAALIVYQHRSNIVRLQYGTENRIGNKAKRSQRQGS